MKEKSKKKETIDEIEPCVSRAPLKLILCLKKKKRKKSGCGSVVTKRTAASKRALGFSTHFLRKVVFLSISLIVWQFLPLFYFFIFRKQHWAPVFQTKKQTKQQTVNEDVPVGATDIVPLTSGIQGLCVCMCVCEGEKGNAAIKGPGDDVTQTCCYRIQTSTRSGKSWRHT